MNAIEGRAVSMMRLSKAVEAISSGELTFQLGAYYLRGEVSMRLWYGSLRKVAQAAARVPRVQKLVRQD